MLESQETHDRWFSPATVPAPMRLFCFPFAGANPNYFLPWRKMLAPQLELRIALLPGHGGRWLEPPIDDMAELVTELSGAIAELNDRPFAFFGHSVGAVVAFEVARRLRHKGLPGPVSLWVSAAEGPQTRKIRRELRELSDADLCYSLRDYNGTPAELLDDTELMQLVLPGVRADFALSECYRYRPEAPLDVPIYLLRSDSDPYVSAAGAAGWARDSTVPLREYVYSGDHFVIQEHRDSVIGLLKAECAQG
jgi:medium-chain acyl-[acyl-carrier-protein] hydrolase